MVTKRLQVLLPDSDYREIQRIARARRVTVAAWVRETLERARRREPQLDAGRRIEAIRGAARHDFPTADIDQMLAEIDAGYQMGHRT